MKTETKALIVIIVMFLSVGPLMFIFGQNKLELPPDKDEPTSHTYSGNFTAAVNKIEPYVKYLGISEENNQAYADDIVKNIAGNYTLDVSLNPNGAGYQYIIKAYSNNTAKLKEMGFKLAYNLADFFIPQQGGYGLPYCVGTVSIFRDFELKTGAENRTIYVTYNQNAAIPLLYSRELHRDAELNCPEIITSLNDTLVRVSSGCIDAEIPREQRYMGLTQEDINSAEIYSEEGQLKVKKIIEYRVGGSYSDKIDPNDLNQYIQQFGVMKYFINPLIHTYSITLNETDSASIERAHNFCRSLNLTIDVEYLQAVADAPEKIIAKGETYDLARITELPLQVKLETKENSTVQANSTYKLIYGEVIDAVAKEKGVLGET